MTPRGKMIVAGVVIAAAIVALLVWKRAQRATTAASAPAPTPASVTAAGAAPAASPPTTAPGSAAPPARARLDAPARQQLLQRLAKARAGRGGGTASPTAAGAEVAPALPPPVLDKTYVQAQVRELIPLIAECYERARETDPALEGKLVVEFTIGGEPEVGGLVETSEVLAGESTIATPGMVECVRETMYGAEFVAPEGGGQVTVRYPFQFRRE